MMKNLFIVILTCLSFLANAQKESIFVNEIIVGPFIKSDTLRGSRADSALAATKNKKPAKPIVRGSAYYSSVIAPVFNERKDSSLYENYVKLLMNFELKKKSRDSIFQIAAKLIQTRSQGYEIRLISDREFRSLSSLQDDVLATAKYVSIQNVKGKLPDRLMQCVALEKLELLNCSFKRLPRTLRNFKKLKSINVINNKIDRPVTLSRNKNITKLLVRGNGGTVPTNFNRLKELSSLDLSGLQLESFPVKALKNKKLKQLLLGGNKITLAKDRLIPCQTLEALDMPGNSIASVPKGISLFTNLKRLNLAGNKIENVDSALANLSKLESISFYGNQLKEIPDAVYNMKNLLDLDLYYNQISKVDERVANWKRLEILYLSNNKIFSLPDNMNELSSLRELYLHNNRLSDLPASMSEMKSLKTLRVNSNYLGSLPTAVEQLAGLENLDLSNNQIRTLPDSFWNLKSLKLLGLVANPWEESTKQIILTKAEELKANQTVVRVTHDPSVD